MEEEKEEKKVVVVDEDPPGFLDRLQQKSISRKFLIWVFASGLLLYKTISPRDWLIVSSIYIGSNAVVQLVSILKNVTWSDK